MLKKLFLAICFITLSQLLPLAAKPLLMLHFKNVAVMLANAAIWFTQPAVSKEETFKNRGRDKFSVLLILFMSMLSVAVSVIDWAYFKNTADNVFLSTAGMFLVVSGILFRVWAIQTLGRHFTPTVQLKTDHQLITWGPYSLVRHPSYLGALAAIAGTALFLNSVVGVVVSVSSMLYAYLIRISVEEKALLELFGTQYQQYQKRIKKLIPFIW